LCFTVVKPVMVPDFLTEIRNVLGNLVHNRFVSKGESLSGLLSSVSRWG
jgi:hypothetical protein